MEYIIKTFSITIAVTGKITVPERILRELRIAAVDGPTEGGDRFLHELGQRTQDDDEFLQGALKNALRNVVRNGLTADIAAMGVGIKARPAAVTVSVPEHVITVVKAREQIAVDRLDVQPNKAEGEFNPLIHEQAA